MGVFWSSKSSRAPTPAAAQSNRYGATEPIEREPSPSRIGDAIALDDAAAAEAGGGGGRSWQSDQQAVWVPDDSSVECMLCKRGFGWFTRKHHCRQCGSLVCAQCSPHRAVARGYLTSQRVCTGCMGAMALAEQSALSSRRQSVSQQQKRRSSRRNSPSRLVADRHAEHKKEEEAKRIRVATEDSAAAASSATIIAAPIAQHPPQSQATVLLMHHQSTSSVSSASSSGLPPQHTPRSRPASPHHEAASHHHASSLSVATTVASPSNANSSPRASIRRGSISPSHSPSRRKSISGSFLPPVSAEAALVGGAAVVAVAAVAASASSSSAAAAAPSPPFLAESLTPLVLFNRLAGFGSLLVLDLRSAEEYKAGHVPRALNIPMSDGDLVSASGDSAAGELQPAECTAMLAALEKRLHMTDQRAFRMRQRCTIVLVGSPYTAAADASSASSSASASTPAPFSLTPHMSSSHHSHCLHLAKLLHIEGKIAAVSVLDGGFDSFATLYPFTVCAYSAMEQKSGKHIHKKPFPWYPNEILPCGIYLGSKVDAANLEHLNHLGVTHVLNCTTEIPNHFEENIKEGTENPAFVYKRIELHDEVNVSISDTFAEAFQFLDTALSSAHGGGGGRVLVHCQEGISRSSTNLIAYLMSRKSLSLQQSYAWVKAQRKQIFPNLGFWRQLDLFERTLMHERLVSEAAGGGGGGGDSSAAVPSIDQLKGTMDQCIDLALLTAEYQARKAAQEAAAAGNAGGGETIAASSSSSSSSSEEETASERVRRQVLSPVEKSSTLRAVRGVAGEDAKIRAEEAVVEEAQTPQGPIVTSEG